MRSKCVIFFLQINPGYRAIDLAIDYGSSNQTPNLSIKSNKSLKSLPRTHGRGAYKFDSPPFDYVRDPELNLISSFTDHTAFEAADNIVVLFQQAVNVCVSVKTAFAKCTSQIQLLENAHLSSIILKIKGKQGYNVKIEIVNANPPRIDLPTSSGRSIHRDVIIACQLLNDAVKLCYEFTNNGQHTRVDRDMLLLKSYHSDSTDIQNAVGELDLYRTFISNVMKQADCFISDFTDSSV